MDEYIYLLNKNIQQFILILFLCMKDIDGLYMPKFTITKLLG